MGTVIDEVTHKRAPIIVTTHANYPMGLILGVHGFHHERVASRSRAEACLLTSVMPPPASLQRVPLWHSCGIG